MCYEKKANIKASVEKKINKARSAKMDIVFESNGGLQIKPEEIVVKIPNDCDAAYVKLEENKIYWVRGEENKNYKTGTKIVTITVK